MAKSEKFYRQVLAEQAQSGLSLRAFAVGRGIPAGTLSCWRHKLKQRDAARASKSKKASKPRFVQVSVAAARPPEPKPEPPRVTSPGSVGYEVVLGQGRVLRLPADFDDARVAALVRAVTSC